jgi:histidinol-phosphate aminotransferase
MPLVPEAIARLAPYEAGRTPEQIAREYGISGAIKLSSNENPLGPSPLALRAMMEALPRLHRYEPGGHRLREALAQRYGVKPRNVITGAGSEGILSNIIRTFLCDEDEALTTESAFIGFQVLVKSRGVAYRTVPYRDWRYDLPALAAAITPRTKIIYLANPNNPTGTIFTRQEFDAFYRHVPERVLIVLDEAYFEYAKDNPLFPDSMTYRYDNVITLRTFSKVYGLAAARIGYGFAHEDLIANLMKVKLPFEPSGPAEMAGIGALADREHLHATLEENAASLRILTEALRDNGYSYVPSEANFVMVVFDAAAEASAFYESLVRQGVITRPLSAFGLPQCVRIATGTISETERCVEAIARREVSCTERSVRMRGNPPISCP